APLRDYLEAVRRQMMVGYQHGGFPQTTVTVSLDVRSGRILVGVVEGPRYTAGGIRIEGARNIPPELLVRRLAEPTPPPASGLGLRRAPGSRWHDPAPALGWHALAGRTDDGPRRPPLPQWLHRQHREAGHPRGSDLDTRGARRVLRPVAEGFDTTDPRR